MPRLERVYRATAVYAPGPHGQPGNRVNRRFLSKRHRDAWAAGRLAGYDAEEGWGHNYGEGRPGIPPADAVEVADSDPITYPDEPGEQRVVCRPDEVAALDCLLEVWLSLNPNTLAAPELRRFRARLKFLETTDAPATRTA